MTNVDLKNEAPTFGNVLLPAVVRGGDIPKGWYVAEAGQNPLHMLWFVVLVNFDDVASNIKNPRHFVAEECDSFEQALRECVKNSDNLVLGDVQWDSDLQNIGLP